MPELMKLPEACARTGCAYIVAWRSVVRGDVPSVRRGRLILVDPRHLADLARAAAAGEAERGARERLDTEQGSGSVVPAAHDQGPAEPTPIAA